ncbi:SUN domain-containing protein 2-like [Melanotaenia boesemani]|uniref:SUN domain-containing protein 2-like n=1 Tax=Melanotaenia boesemani TaxID=1250792 RepID=UPI001C03D2CF|nr:SUN domain-containing protein 2-like [Melanotaenia boesemani]
MSRRSVRLASIGYYDSNGIPTINYKETPWRSRKKRKVCPQVPEEMISPVEEEFPVCNSNTFDADEECSQIKLLLSILCVVLIIFSLGFAFLINTMSIYRSEQYSEEPCFKIMYKENFKLKWKELPQAEFLPNVALASLGANIVSGRTSASYDWNRPFFCKLFRKCKLVSPGVVIQGSSDLRPGNCWSFAGQQGHITINLPYKVPVSHVILGHILKSVSPSGTTPSAPKAFSVYGKKTVEDEGTLLGNFTYDNDGEQFQTFKTEGHSEDTFSFVKLKVNSNWGKPEYTCLYNVKVHGTTTNTNTKSLEQHKTGVF